MKVQLLTPDSKVEGNVLELDRTMMNSFVGVRIEVDGRVQELRFTGGPRVAKTPAKKKSSFDRRDSVAELPIVREVPVSVPDEVKVTNLAGPTAKSVKLSKKDAKRIGVAVRKGLESNPLTWEELAKKNGMHVGSIYSTMAGKFELITVRVQEIIDLAEVKVTWSY